MSQVNEKKFAFETRMDDFDAYQDKMRELRRVNLEIESELSTYKFITELKQESRELEAKADRKHKIQMVLIVLIFAATWFEIFVR